MKEGLQLKGETETFVGKNIKITVSKEEWNPAIDAHSVEGHEALHAAIGKVPKWVSARPGRMGGIAYRGITLFDEPPGALERLAPAVMGGHGTSFDEGNGKDGETKQSIGSTVIYEVNKKKGEIFEVQEALKDGPLTGSGVIAAKERGRLKMKFGEYANVTAESEDGDKIRITTKMNGDATRVPTEIIHFTRKKDVEEKEKAKMNEAEKQKKAEEVLADAKLAKVRNELNDLAEKYDLAA